MPLDLPGLKSDLKKILDGTTPSATPSAAGNAWGNAYHSFAQTGTASAVPPVVAGPVKDAMKSALGSGFALPGVAATVALGIATALDVYWAGAVFAGSIGVPASTGTAVLVSSLTSIFLAIGGTYDSKATQIAAALLTYTNGVMVNYASTLFPVV